MSILFRVDASPSMGMGHLMRCLALAQAFAELGVESRFLLSSGSKDYCLSRHDWVGNIQLLPDAIAQSQEVAWLQQQAWLDDISTLVLDGYQFDSDYRQQLQQLPCQIALFDDTNDSGPLLADIIVNGSGAASDLGYANTAPQAIHCLGDTYRVLRQEFCYPPEVPWPQRHSLLIMLGGSDSKQYTLKLVEGLAQATPDIPLRVMTGGGFAHKSALINLLQRIPNPNQHLDNCQQVADVMAHCRMAISAAGSSQFELQVCGVPTQLLVVADNQLPASEQAQRQGWCYMHDARQELPLEAIVQQTQTLWRDDTRLAQMHQHALEQGDAQGSLRVAQTILEAGQDV